MTFRAPAHRPRRAAALAALALLAGASSCASGSLAGSASQPDRVPSYPTADSGLATRTELQEIRRLEGARTDGDGRLQELLEGHPDAGVRARAARALGRLPYPEWGAAITQALCRALRDEDASVRAEAAFALEQREDPAGAGVLLASWRDDTSGLVRARIVAAAGRVHNGPIRSQILRAMQDPDLRVKRAAVLATALWPDGLDDAARTDEELRSLLLPFPDATGRRVLPDPELVWTVLYALSRRRSDAAAGSFQTHARSSDPRARIFSARGLARITPSREGTQTLVAALQDPDWRVACEAAAGLGRSGDPLAVDALIDAVDHRAHHVRRHAITALGGFPEQRGVILPVAWRARQDVSGSVRAASLETLARLLEASEAAKVLRDAAEDDDPVVRAGAAAAASIALDDFRAVPLLVELGSDDSAFVATRAIDGLKRHLTPRSRSALLELLRSPDNGIRLAAVGALGHAENAVEEDAAALAEVLRSSSGDIASEVAFNTIRVLGSLAERFGIAGDAREAVVEALEHEDPFVRRVAREVLERDFTVPIAPPEPRPTRDPEEVPLPGVDFPAWTRNPVAEIVTSHGSMTFELFAGDAPWHVDNFVRRARQGYYDGLTFHRVVPDFVVQGGDPRGDGNGGGAERGGSLPQEFTTRSYERGALGMPRNEDFDSGGSQIFVTHRPTPHLNGRYTLFGQLRLGEDVLDRIDVGGVIFRVLVSP